MYAKHRCGTMIGVKMSVHTLRALNLEVARARGMSSWKSWMMRRSTPGCRTFTATVVGLPSTLITALCTCRTLRNARQLQENLAQAQLSCSNKNAVTARVSGEHCYAHLCNAG